MHDRFRALKDRLQAFTGNEVTTKTLSEAIGLYNRMRELLRKIGLMRRSPSPPLRAMDFVTLNQASFYADPASLVEVLDSVYKIKGETGGCQDRRTQAFAARTEYSLWRL